MEFACDAGQATLSKVSGMLTVSLSTVPMLATEEQVTNEYHRWSDILIMTSVILSFTLLGDICHHCRIIVVT